ncbi:MAG: hypothetical protein WA667_10905 [Candidatus Nitrosopolaris sp.]
MGKRRKKEKESTPETGKAAVEKRWEKDKDKSIPRISLEIPILLSDADIIIRKLQTT